MGGGTWSNDSYKARSARFASAKVDEYVHTTDVVAGRTKNAVNDKVNPKNVIRESRDSVEHPNSNAVVVYFDITGSMKNTPRQLQKNLPALMGMLIRGNYIADPQVMISAFGDATCDKAPLQVGQFESGIQIAETSEYLYLEGGGGNGKQESTELAMYYLANKVEMDCLTKRGKRGYAFFITDEPCYPSVKRQEVEKLIGDTLQADIPTEEIIADLCNKFEVFVIIPRNTNHGAQPKLHEFWRDKFGQNVIVVDNVNDIAQLIAGTIGVNEGESLETVSRHAGKDLTVLSGLKTDGTMTISGLDIEIR